MEDKFRIGVITKTHGIKGEVKILSDINYKNLVFKKNQKLVVDNDIYIEHRIYFPLD